MGKLVGLLSSGVGLAMEAKAAYQTPNRSKAPLKQNYSSQTNQSSSRYDSQYQDSGVADRSMTSPYSQEAYPHEKQRVDDAAFEDVQEYADYQRRLLESTYDEMDAEGPYSNTQSSKSPYDRPYGGQIFPPYQPPPSNPVQRSMSSSSAASPGALLDPVIIPQRRPGDKSRGWTPAYAPALLSCGISQETFLKFLNAFNSASKSSPYLDAVNVAAFGAGFAPGITPMIVSMVVPIAVRAAKQQQTNSQSSAYLKKANKEIFQPKGLFALVMTFNPSQQQIDNIQPQDVEPQLPISAPLIYLSDEDYHDPAAEASKMKQVGHFIADYGDRRARATYAQENPSASSILGPTPSFRSRWGDPTNEATNGNGGLRGLITGQAQPDRGRSNRDQRRQDKDDRKRRKSKDRQRGFGLIGAARQAVTSQMGSARTGPNGERQSMIGGVKGMAMQSAGMKKDQSLIKGIKGIGMETDLLYLMIVNNPDSAASSPAPSTPSGYGDYRNPIRPASRQRSMEYSQQQYSAPQQTSMEYTQQQYSAPPQRNMEYNPQPWASGPGTGDVSQDRYVVVSEAPDSPPPQYSRKAEYRQAEDRQAEQYKQAENRQAKTTRYVVRRNQNQDYCVPTL